MEIPALLYRHRKDFVSTSEGTPDNADAALLQYLKAKLSPYGKGAEIEKYLEALESKDKKFSLKITPLSEQLTFGYDFSSLSWGSKQSSPKSSPESKLKHKLAEQQAPDSKSRPSYAFTEETLSFVEKHSAMLAALVHLLCPPINKGIQLIESSTLSVNKTRDTKETARDTADKAPAVAQVSPPSKTRPTLTKNASIVAPLPGAESDSRTRPTLTKNVSIVAPLPGAESDSRTRPTLTKSAIVAPLPGAESDSRTRPTLTKSVSIVAPLPGAESEPDPHLCLEAILERFATLPAMQRHLRFRLEPFLRSALIVKGDTSDARQLALIAGGSSVLGDACVDLIQGLLREGRAGEAVKLLRTEPVVSSPGKVRFMRDLVVSTHFAGLCSLKSVSDSGTGDLGRGNAPSKTALASLLFQISDPSLATRLVLSSLHDWSVETAVFLLEYCMSHLPSSSPLHTLLVKKLDILILNRQIMETFSGRGAKGAQKDGEEEGGRWKSWADLERESCSRPKHVLELMLEAGLSNDLVQLWAAEHKLGWEVTKVIMGLGLRDVEVL